MIQRRDLNNRPGIRALITIMVAFICALLQSGCAVGYVTFHSGDTEREQAIPNLPDIKLTYFYGSPESSVKQESTFTLAFERTLRSRFHILDIQKAASAGGKNDDRFVVDV